LQQLSPGMIEDLLYRMQSTKDPDAARVAIERLSVEYGLPLDLFYEGELTHTEIARLLDWPTSTVSQRLTRAISLLHYGLHPERFLQAETILAKPLPKRPFADYENTK
jgi:DNA-directed RNA polymerase specialized sigma24 family protein